MKIVSGRGDEPHVTSSQFRQFIEGTVGETSYILQTGEHLEPELASNNLLRVKSGMMCHHGNISSIENGTYDEIIIQNGTQGMKRIDIVVNRYTFEEETETEKNEWVVIQGTPKESNPTVPTCIEGDLRKGDLIDDCLTFEIHLEGINVTEIKKRLPIISSIYSIESDVYNQKVLWSGSTYLGDNQIVKLSEHISDQKNGIVLVWQRYNPGEGATGGYIHSFIPKNSQAIGAENMECVDFLTNYTAGYVATKTYYLKDTQINGHPNNETGETKQSGSGITTNNNRFALVKVLGC